jgi:hypothetical protein
VPVIISPAKTASLQPVTIVNDTGSPITATPETSVYTPSGSHCLAGGSSPVQLSTDHTVTVPAHGRVTVVPSGNVPAGDYLVGWHVGGTAGSGTAVSYILDSQQVVAGGGSSANCAVSHRVARTIAPRASAAHGASSIPVSGIAIGAALILVIALCFVFRIGKRHKGTHAHG